MKSRALMLYEIGCIACRQRSRWRVATIHHLNLDQHAGQKRRGDEYTIPLCTWHHQGYSMDGCTNAETEEILGPSMAHEPRRFREVFGSDDELLERTNSIMRARYGQPETRPG